MEGASGAAPFLLPLWEKVARKARRMRGSHRELKSIRSAERDPSPGFAFREATLSHKGRGYIVLAVTSVTCIPI